MRGLVIRNTGSWYVVRTDDGQLVDSKIKGNFRPKGIRSTNPVAVGDFVPSGCEFKFGSGKIDRIDACEDENAVYVKVTDYKTGRKAFDITAFYHGLQMQLPVYLNAALEIERQKHPEKEVLPAGIFY